MAHKVWVTDKWGSHARTLVPENLTAQGNNKIRKRRGSRRENGKRRLREVRKTEGSKRARKKVPWERSGDRGPKRPKRWSGPEEMGDRSNGEPMHDQSLPRYTTPSMGTARQWKDTDRKGRPEKDSLHLPIANYARDPGCASLTHPVTCCERA